MARTAPPNLTTRIALPYRIYFLYLDPVLALFGVYLIATDPAKFLASTVPEPLSLSLSLSTASSSLSGGTSDALPPIIHLLLTNIGALYAFLAASLLTLHVTSELRVWRALIAALALSDAGHLYACWVAAPERVLAVLNWGVEERVNMGILGLGLGLRVCFLLGWGVRG